MKPSEVKCVYLEAAGHSLAEPDVLLLLDVLAGVPALVGNNALSGVDAGLSGLHVAVDLDGVLSAALVGVDPVLTWTRTRNSSSTFIPGVLKHLTSLDSHFLFQWPSGPGRPPPLLANVSHVLDVLEATSICWNSRTAPM